MEPEPDDGGWSRLNPLMLLVHPVREVGRFVLPLVFVFVAGSPMENPWQLLAVLVPVAIGVARYLTTRYRIAGARVELRTGLISRRALSVPLDRVRSVDLTASPIHRILGLTTVEVGTGAGASDGETIQLDALGTDQARQLRQMLLERASDADPEAPEHSLEVPVATVAKFDAAWLRFAPFTSSGFAISAAILGVAGQALGSRGEGIELAGLPDVATGALVALALVGLVVASAVLSVIGYLFANGNFTLVRGREAWNVTRGLLTTRETSLDVGRVAGVRIGEPLGLRLARGARLTAIATGLRGLGADNAPSSALVPPAPRAVIDHAAASVCGTPGPVQAPLRGHGAAAVRRRWTRAVVPAIAVFALLLSTWLLEWTPGWTVAVAALGVAGAAALAADRTRALGHALVDRFLVARSGSLLRGRDMLHTDHVIGWTFQSSFWQRRAGLTTLVVTTAGGRQRVVVLDVPEAAAVELATSAVAGLVEQFSEPAQTARSAG